MKKIIFLIVSLSFLLLSILVSCILISYYIAFEPLTTDESYTTKLLNDKYSLECDYSDSDLRYEYKNHPNKWNRTGVGHLKYSTELKIFYKSDLLYEGKIQVISSEGPHIMAPNICK